MTRNLAIGALLGFGFTVLALALWGGRTPEAPPPAVPAAPAVAQPDPFPQRKLGVPLDRVGRMRALPEPGAVVGAPVDAGS